MAIGEGVRVVSVVPRAGALVITLEGARPDRTIALEVGVRARWAGRFAAHPSVARGLDDPARWGRSDAAVVAVEAGR